MSDVSRALLAAIVNATPEIAAFIDSQGEVEWTNPAFITRWPCAETPTVRGLLDVVHPDDRPLVENAFDVVRAGGPRTVVQRARLGCDHVYREGRVRFTRVDSNGEHHSVLIHVEDLEPRFVDGGDLDPLTGVADRAALLSEIDSAITAETVGQLLLLDLDHFHLVNTSLGHAAGDDLLITVARRLRGAAHDGDVVARVSGDAFAVLCCHQGPRAATLADRLRTEVRRPITLGFTNHVVDASIGTVSLDVVFSTIEALAAVDAAVHLAKSRGRGRTEVFDKGLRDSAVSTLRRTTELREAVVEGALTLRFQPIVDLDSGRTVGCEGLLRWIHPEEGELGAGEFIDVAEAAGLVDALTDTLLNEACAAVRELPEGRADGRPPYVSVNLSPQQLVNPRIIETIDAALRRWDINPAQLMVEITETTMMHDVQTAVATLTALRNRGVRVALDDFGTGYSSLLRLRELPVDCLKIDRAFVSGIVRSVDDLSIVASVVNMATTLGLEAIAEGVETEDQAQQLRKLGCRSAQGFLWSPAVPISRLPAEPGRRARRPRRTPKSPALDPHLIAWIMRLHGSGASLHSIAAVLNQSGTRTPTGARWHPRSVARVVARAAYPLLEGE